MAQQAEIAELRSELTAIGTRTTFAGNTVFQDYSGVGNALTFHVGANAGVTISIAADYSIDLTGAAGIFSSNISTVDVSADADAAIGVFDTAISDVSGVRSTLGATQNRLEHVVANLSVAIENLSASESRVRDTDMALEMVSFTRHQIMSQAGTAMLAQANQVPGAVLQLLG